MGGVGVGWSLGVCAMAAQQVWTLHRGSHKALHEAAEDSAEADLPWADAVTQAHAGHTGAEPDGKARDALRAWVQGRGGVGRCDMSRLVWAVRGVADPKDAKERLLDHLGQQSSVAMLTFAAACALFQVAAEGPGFQLATLAGALAMLLSMCESPVPRASRHS